MANSRAFKRLVFREKRRQGIKYGAVLRQLRETGESGAPQPPTVAFVGMAGGSGRSTLALAVAAELCRRDFKTLYVEVVERSQGPLYGDFRGLMPHVIKKYAPPGHHGPLVAEMDDRQIAEGDLEQMSRDFDVVLLDAARDVDCQYASLMTADLGIVPSGHDAIRGLETVARILKRAQRRRPIRDGFVRGAIIREKPRREQEALGAVLRKAGIEPFETVLSRTYAYELVVERGFSLTGPRLRTVRTEMHELVDELFPDGQKVPAWSSRFRRDGFPLYDSEDGSDEELGFPPHSLVDLYWTTYDPTWRARRLI